jgi:regulatory protein
MDLLARREHSRRELQRKLEHRFPAQEVAEALDRLAEQGLQSDQRFAQGFARERALRGYGPRRILNDLLSRGISGAAADTALSILAREEHIDWARQARSVLERKFGGAPAEDFADRARRLRFLQNRGFTGDALADLGGTPEELSQD